MQRYRLYYLFMVIFLSLRPVSAFEVNALIAPTVYNTIVVQNGFQTDWVTTQDFISLQVFSSSSQQTTIQAEIFSPMQWDERTPFERNGDESAVIIRGQSPLGVSNLLSSLFGNMLSNTRNSFSGRVRFDYLTDFDDVSRVGGDLFVNIRGNLGVDASTYQWKRKLSAGGTEKIKTTDANLIYSLSQNSRFRVRSGAGMLSVQKTNDASPQYGYNFVSAIDVYLINNLFFTGEMDWGKIDHRSVLHYRTSLGYYFRPVEIFVGYETFKLDGLDKLDGLIFGGNIRF